jgi:hypothetical protein
VTTSSDSLDVTRFSADGIRIDSFPVQAGASPFAIRPAVATNGREFLVAWSASSASVFGVFATRLDSTGRQVDAQPIAVATSRDHHDIVGGIASDGTDFVVAYVESQPFTDLHTVMVKRVLRNGELGDTTASQEGLVIGDGTRPQITHSGTAYVVSFVDDDDVGVFRHEMTLYACSVDNGALHASPATVVFRAESHAFDTGLTSLGGRVWTAYSRLDPELASVQRVFLRPLDGVPRRRAVRR